jgi:hypothetical protein
LERPASNAVIQRFAVLPAEIKWLSSELTERTLERSH